MPYGAILAPVAVYCAIAGISSSALSASVRISEQDLIFPVSRSARILIFGGGVFCVAFGAYGFFSDLNIVVSLCMLLLGLTALFIPFRPIIVSASGVETQRALWWKKRALLWNEIDRVEVWKAGRMVVLIHGRSSITHTRYHVDQSQFIHQVQLHVARDKWQVKGNF